MIARLQPSTAQKKILNETGISSIEELMYADLQRAGWDKGDAFYAAFHNIVCNYTQAEQRKVMKEIDAREPVARRVSTRSVTEGGLSISAEELARETSKEKILADLVRAKRGMKEGSKEWAETTKMIADYSKIKQDNLKTDNQPIQYFLPVAYPKSCKDCLLRENKEPQYQESNS